MSIDHIRKLKAEADDPKPKKTYKIPRVSKKKLQKIEEAKDMAKLDQDFYLEIWHASPHRCQNCNCNLGRTAHNFMFHHLLEKRNYPQFRHTQENIMIVCLQCHSQIETNITFAPKAAQRRLEVENLLINQHNP